MFDQSRLNYHDLEEYSNAQDDRFEKLNMSLSAVKEQYSKMSQDAAIANEKVVQGKLHFEREIKAEQDAIIFSMQNTFDSKINELNEIMQSKEKQNKHLHTEYEAKFDLLKRGYDQQKGIAEKLTSELALDFSQADTVSFYTFFLLPMVFNIALADYCCRMEMR